MQPWPRVGQLPLPQGGAEKDWDDETWVLKLDSCFLSFFEPQLGQTGLRDELTSCSKISLQDWQMYSNSGMEFRIYCDETNLYHESGAGNNRHFRSQAAESI